MKFSLWILLAACLLRPASALALEPAEVAVVANRFVEESVELARYYMAKRGIPKENLIKIDTTEKESCSREDYDEEIAGPVRDFLRKRQDIRCLVTLYGVPLKVAEPDLTREEKKQLEQLQVRQKALREEQQASAEQKKPEDPERKKQLADLDKQIKALRKGDQAAAVDSELTLVLSESHPLQLWVPNPYFLGFRGQILPVKKEAVRFVARLDAPSPTIVNRMIDDSLSAEAEGLSGKAYFDARWPKSQQQELQGYAFYDQSLHLAAERVQLLKPRLPVVVNDKPELLQPGEAPNAALYCGWYSLSRYVDAFDWRPGAVGYHIASGECTTLRAGSGQGWCKRMLEDGIAATIGPVAEPYVQSFPVPELFFRALLDGYYSLAEAYYLSLPYLSWQMVLVGDPLYRPFKNRTE